MREVRIHSVLSLMMSDEEGNDVELEGGATRHLCDWRKTSTTQSQRAQFA